MRSLKVPGSPSSPLTAIRRGAFSARTRPHLRPVGNPAPPRPRSPPSESAAITSSTLRAPDRDPRQRLTLQDAQQFLATRQRAAQTIAHAHCYFGGTLLSRAHHIEV